MATQRVDGGDGVPELMVDCFPRSADTKVTNLFTLLLCVKQLDVR